MAKRSMSPRYILPTRMSFQIPPHAHIHFSILDFPFSNAFQAFWERFKRIYQQKHNKEMSYGLRLSFRQLNDALLALAPSLIQGFEGEGWNSRMVAFSRYDENGQPEDFPSVEQIRSLLRFWLERWGAHPEIRPLLDTDGREAWEVLMAALEEAPETKWEHGITTQSLTDDLNHTDGLAFIALPALLTALVHTKEMTIQSEKGEYIIRWRRANEGGKHGLHLVSQPISFQGDYFAYALDFSIQTQAGYGDKRKPAFWIFAHLSIQRYITEQYRGGNRDRNISILVGYNREGFASNNRWDDDTTLIALKADTDQTWREGVGKLLDDFSVRKLLPPHEILKSPASYGIYSDSLHKQENEYYVVYAEGRKFSDDSRRGRQHQVKTGTSLRERSQIMAGVLQLLQGWLQISPALEYDRQNPENTFALRDYDDMVKKPQKNAKQVEAWQAALQTSLANSARATAHVVVLYRSDNFAHWAKAQIEEALMGVDKGDQPLAAVTLLQLPPLLYAPLDPGNLDPSLYYKPAAEKPAGFLNQWNEQMRLSYRKKREEWRSFLQDIAWQPNARRLLLIDSTGEFGLPSNQKIKGAVREACVREGISSQFLVGNLKADTSLKRSGKLTGESGGRLKNAVLDLLLRQQGILYAPPRELYHLAAGLEEATASQLDVVAFCRVQRNQPKLHYGLAVRLRAGGEVDVMLPGENMAWLPYDAAAYYLGRLFADQYTTLNRLGHSALRLDHGAMVKFVEMVLTTKLERPTLAVIEAEGWRNGRGQDEAKHCWTQLRNSDLARNLNVLRFDNQQTYARTSPKLDLVLGVVRLRMNHETPQYITAEALTAEDPMRDLRYLTGYVDPCVDAPLHYMSIAGLSNTQKAQKGKHTVEAFKGDPKTEWDNLAYKHPQMVELVPFFVHPRYQHEEGQRQLCRCIHFLRLSPGFTIGEITLPYPMHLGDTLINDMLCIIGGEE
ncbi:MAG: DUF3962 domain-containing protein [bacterium]|nr:DUF3962 domain-containing protein [bacterium]